MKGPRRSRSITSLKFFFDITVRRPDMTLGMQAVQLPQKLPVVLSRDEVARLIAAAPSLKYQTAFALAYALFEIPGGWMGDKIGPRKVLMRIVIWWSFFTAITGFMWDKASLVVARFLFGAGEAGLPAPVSG